MLSCGYYPIQWSIDSLDWKDYGVDDIITRICDNKQLTGGAIILCHNGAKYTADALVYAADAAGRKGVSVCANFRINLSGELSFRCDRKADFRLNGRENLGY